MNYLKRKREIKDKCNIYRDNISLNLYYLNKAPEKLSGSKLIFVIKTLKNENNKLYNKIKSLECKGTDEIILTMKPKLRQI